MVGSDLMPRVTFRRMLVVALAVAVIGPALPLAAKSVCCEGSKQMLCRVKYRVGPIRAMKPFTGQDLSLDVGENVVLEVEGVDARKKKYPNDHVYMGYDLGNDCHGKLDVDRLSNRAFRLRAGKTVGKCTLQLWAAGNENVHKKLLVRVGGSSSSGDTAAKPLPAPGNPATLEPTRPQADLTAEAIVKRLYKALLRRQPSPAAMASSAAEVKAGHLDKLADSMVRSPEFRNSLRQRPAKVLLDEFYRGLLGRAPDSSSSGHLRTLESGRTYEVVMAILRSTEFREVIKRDTAR